MSVVGGLVFPGSTGLVGERLIRGPAALLGYYDDPHATDAAYLRGLWVSTGDRASIDERGWLSIRGRSKDIIRGGENIPVADVESVIFDILTSSMSR